jgi:hypothetical protein
MKLLLTHSITGLSDNGLGAATLSPQAVAPEKRSGQFSEEFSAHNPTTKG